VYSVRIRIEGFDEDFENESHFLEYVEAMLDEMLERSDRNGKTLRIFIQEGL
jgi:hypothetical protein